MAIDTIFVEEACNRPAGLRALLHHAWCACHAWSITRRTRHALVEMTDEQLRDIGVSRAEATREIRKSIYWD
ncbi:MULTISPECIES: DUF1127 domain-containing protein [unclassified Shinella]|uniref:DUF1127 domain-containing protein n=1 Tax=unclassified Shinella TaxID=2643062 RepID=UPI0003C54B1C|nr:MULTISPECIES: DUF1127 domain-containing protein [unclassified Shinella]EYR79091.1 hypothetical protein SHLA_69c000100 [Shinella sp. DD12]MCA0343943.1 DUF1127 domain-containing protein [Pseudomonadota bacterium]MCO5150050.1 DUF1127 domain-containing protein [Shinella sp.]MDG4674642.1 DUF1127 domain-containing protein [Shinella sp. 838]